MALRLFVTHGKGRNGLRSNFHDGFSPTPRVIRHNARLYFVDSLPRKTCRAVVSCGSFSNLRSSSVTNRIDTHEELTRSNMFGTGQLAKKQSEWRTRIRVLPAALVAICRVPLPTSAW